MELIAVDRHADIPPKYLGTPIADCCGGVGGHGAHYLGPEHDGVQLAIDPNQSPRLRLLVDQSDLSAEALQPVLQSDHVTVQSYRKLRWGQKLGVFLEAA